MKKLQVTILSLIFIIASVSFGLFYFSKNKVEKQVTFTETEGVSVIKKSNIEMLLTDIGWYNTKTITLLSGNVIKRSAIKDISVEYGSYIGPYLRQGNVYGEIFASVNVFLDSSTLKFIIYVEPNRITESQNKNWWIDHQVIRALNKMVNPTLTDDELIEKDRTIFEKYNGKIDLWEIKL